MPLFLDYLIPNFIFSKMNPIVVVSLNSKLNSTMYNFIKFSGVVQFEAQGLLFNVGIGWGFRPSNGIVATLYIGRFNSRNKIIEVKT